MVLVEELKISVEIEDIKVKLRSVLVSGSGRCLYILVGIFKKFGIFFLCLNNILGSGILYIFVFVLRYFFFSYYFVTYLIGEVCYDVV